MQLVVRAADHGATYLTWRCPDEPRVADFAALDRDDLGAVLEELHAALPGKRHGEDGRAAAERALGTGAFADPVREAALSNALSAAVLPGELARRLTAVDAADRVRLRVTPSPRLAQVPWELLVLPDGRRLVEVADVCHDPPATLFAGRGRSPGRWADVAHQPVVYLLEPRPPEPRYRPVLDERADPAGVAALARWCDQRVVDGRLRADDRPDALHGATGRAALGRRLREHPVSRLVYFGHAGAADDEPGSAAVYLADSAAVYGLARAIGNHRPFTALDLLHGTATAGAAESGWPVDTRAAGHRIWPMPQRMAIIGCSSGGDHRFAEPFGLVLACLDAGAELVTATRWSLPSFEAFRLVRPELAATAQRPTAGLMQAVDRCHDHDDPVGALGDWQRERLAAWQAGGDVVDTPLLWAALGTHVAPSRALAVAP